MPPVAPKKNKQKEENSNSYWDMLMAAAGQLGVSKPKPVNKPKPVAVVVSVPPKQNYSIGQTEVINGTTGLDTSGWNPVVVRRPELPLPSPSVLPLDLKRKTAILSGYTDDTTNRLYQTPLSFRTDLGDYAGMYEGDPGSAPGGKITVWNPDIPGGPTETLQHEFAHATQPVGMTDFESAINKLAGEYSDPAQGAIDSWNEVAKSYLSDPKVSTNSDLAMNELYARFAQGLNNDPAYRRSQVPQWFIDQYYPGIYK